MESFFNQIDKYLSQVLGNQAVSTTLIVFLVLYAVMAAPNLPPFLATLFDNIFFKIGVLFLVLLVNNYDPTVAILTVVAFVVSLQTLNRYRMLSMGNAMLNGMQEPNANARLQFAKSNAPQAGAYVPTANVGPSLLDASVSGFGALGNLGAALGSTVAGYVPAASNTLSGIGTNAYGVSQQALQGVQGLAGQTQGQLQSVAGQVQNHVQSLARQMQAQTRDPTAAYEGFAQMQEDCAKPQPFAQDLTLPPQPPVQEDVAAVMNPNCQYMGPQGMQYPQGYPGTIVGANYAGCDSEL